MPGGVSPAAAAPAPAYLQPDLRFSSAPPKTMHWLGIVGMAVIVGLTVFFAFNARVPQLPKRDQEIGYRFGFFLWPILIGMVVAWLVAGRKRRRDPNLFAILFCSIAAGVAGLTVVGNLRTTGSLPFHGPETTDQKITRLMREAGGAQPVHKSWFGESSVDATLRDMFTELIAYNKNYTAAAAKIDLSKVRLLNTPQAFADPDSAAEGLRELHAAYDLDSLETQRMQQFIAKYRARFAALSPSDKSITTGFDKGLAQSAPLRNRAISGEQAWIASVDQVYDYARAHHSSFKFVNAHLVIADHAALLEFNSRIHTMNQDRLDFLAAKKQLDDFQHNTLQKFGLTPQQTGRSPH
jgi:hypothetical protein